MNCYLLITLYNVPKLHCINTGRLVLKKKPVVFCVGDPRRGGGLPYMYITDGDARRHFQKKPLKVTILGVAPAILIP